MSKWFSKRTKEQGIHVITNVKYSPAIWLKCKLVIIASLVQRRSPLERGCSLCAHTTTFHFSSIQPICFHQVSGSAARRICDACFRCEEIPTSLAMKGESSQNDLIINSNSAWKPKEIMSCIDFDKDMKGNINTTIESICKHASNVSTNPQQWKLVAKKTSESREVFKELCKALHDQELQKNVSSIENWIPLEEELLRILEEVEILIKDCCDDEWLMVAIKQGNMKETFAKFLHDIQWQMSLLCSILVSTSDIFEPTSCDGNLLYTDRFNLLTAAKHDREHLKDLLKCLKGGHVCDDESCKQNMGEKCLAAKLIDKLDAEGKEMDWFDLKSSPHFLWVNPHDLQKGRRIGRGAFAKVRETTWLGEKFAHKIFVDGPTGQPSFIQELVASEGLNHPHIMHIVCCSEDGHKFGIVMERMFKSLFELLKDYRLQNTNTISMAPPFSNTQVVDLMLQIAEGARYIHSKSLVHRDLKSLNILVKFVDPKMAIASAPVNAPLILKISDFGLTKVKNMSTRYSHQTLNTGTRQWMAPEVFDLEDNDEPPSGRFQPNKIDVYSFAIVCFELLTGKEPYHDQFRLKTRVKAGERPKLPEGIPSRMAVLIQRCWDTNPRRRPDFSAICKELRYIKGLLLRGDKPKLEQTEIPSFQLGGAKVSGPWGGNGGSHFFDGIVTSIKRITVKHDLRPRCIWYFEAEYDINGITFTVGHGDVSHGSKTETIKFTEPGEFLAQIKGTVGITPAVTFGPHAVTSVTSLTICSNVKEYGPFGGDSETPFQSERGRIVGFYGRSGMVLDQIGSFVVLGEEDVYFEDTDYERVKAW